MQVVGWYGWVYPAGTPQAIVDKTNAALKEVLARPRDQASSSRRSAPSCMSRRRRNSANIIDDEIAKWNSVRDKAGLEPQ